MPGRWRRGCRQTSLACRVVAASLIGREMDGSNPLERLVTMLQREESDARGRAADPKWRWAAPDGTSHNFGKQTLDAVRVARRALRSYAAETESTPIPGELVGMLYACKMAYEAFRNDVGGFGGKVFDMLIRSLGSTPDAAAECVEQQRAKETHRTMRFLAITAGSIEPESLARSLWPLIEEDMRSPLGIARRALELFAQRLCPLQYFGTLVIEHLYSEPEWLLRAYRCLLCLRDGARFGTDDVFRKFVDRLPRDTQVLDYFLVRNELGRTQGLEDRLNYVGFAFDAGAPDTIRAKLCLSHWQENNREIADYRGHLLGTEVEQRARGIMPVLNISLIGPGGVDDPLAFMRRLKSGRVYHSLVRGLLSERPRVLVCAVGDVARVALEALPGADGELGLKHAFVYSGESALLSAYESPATEVPGALQGALILGGCNYDQVRTSPQIARLPGRAHVFEPIEGSTREVEQVARILGGNAARGSDADKTTLLALRGPPIVHLATHGFFVDRQHYIALERGEPGTLLDVPEEAGCLYQGIVLDGANLGTCRDGVYVDADAVLTETDVLTWDLEGTRMVVLSACESGLGSVEAGRGALGLARAFLDAGARTVVSTLWPIADDDAALFVQSFYEHVARGQRPSYALLSARRQLKEQGVETWGAFIVAGADDAIFAAMD